MFRRAALIAALALAGCGPPPASEPVAAETGLIPAAFDGVWDTSLEACAGANHPERFEIDGDELKFWESAGTATKVEQQDGGAVLIIAAMEGEGLVYEGRLNYKLSPDGASLVRTHTLLEVAPDGTTAPPAVSTYYRCPA